MKADTSNVLMSESLRGQIPELEDEHPVDILRGKHVIVVTEKIVAGKSEGMVGILRGVLLGSDPEIELRCELKEALGILKADSLSFTRFELHHGEETVVPIPGPFTVKAARLDEVDVVEQVCTLGLHLQRQVR